MRRPANAFSIIPVFLYVGLTLSGCGGDGGIADNPDDPPASPAVTGMLRLVRNAGELESSLKEGLGGTAVTSFLAGAVALPSGDAGSFSNTYTLEAGVDEFDYVRYDGTHLYAVPSTYGATQRAIRILRTEPRSGTATEVSTIPLDADQYVNGMYVANGRLVLLTSEVSLYPFGDLWAAAIVWAPTKMAVKVFDVSDPAHPAPLLSARIDGGLVGSRRIGDRVFVVSRHTPQVVLDPARAAHVKDVALNDLLPQITFDGRARSLVDPRRCYVTNDERREGYPVLTTIMAFSLRNPRDFTSTCYGESANGMYVSQTALYLSQPRLSGAGARVTRIHKFSLSGAVPDYAGSVEVAGELWGSGQNDFRINEHQGLLRVVTTDWMADSTDLVDYRLFILRQKTTERALEVIAQLPNDKHPEEIGKPGERLFAVRFAGARAYAVTFRQVDPLYVIDLSNPDDPNIAGRLELPGFSDFLHPVTDNLLLGLGSDQGHVKVELFDVSVLAQPLSRGAVTLGGFRSSSEALHDRHAFTYLPDVDGVDRFAIPVDTMIGGGNPPYVYQSALYQFEIQGKQSAASAWLRSAGSVTPASAAVDDETAYLSRSFLHGDTVYYVRNGKVWSSSWLTPGQVQGPF